MLKIFFLHKKEEEENYYKPVRPNNFCSNNFEEYLNKRKTRPYLKDIINNLKKSDTWKIQ